MKFKKFGKMALCLMLVVSVLCFTCIPAGAVVVADDMIVAGCALAALSALAGVTYMNATNSGVWQNMASDITSAYYDTTSAMHDNAVILYNWCADYSAKVASSTGEMIEVSGLHISNAINAMKNYYTAKAVDSAFSGITLSTTSGTVSVPSVASTWDGKWVTTSNLIYSANANQTFTDFLSALRSFVSTAPTGQFYSLPVEYDADVNTELSRLYDLNKSTVTMSNISMFDVNNFPGVSLSVPNVSMEFNGDSVVGTAIIKIIHARYDYELYNFISNGVLIGYGLARSQNRTVTTPTNTLSIPYYIGLLVYSNGRIGFPYAGGVFSSSGFERGGATGLSLHTFNQGVATTSYISANTEGAYWDLIGSAGSYVANPTSDVVFAPSIPDTVISGQYGTKQQEIADRIGAVVGGADVIGLSIPGENVFTGQDVYNPSIDDVISGTAGAIDTPVSIPGSVAYPLDIPISIPIDTPISTAIDTATADIADVATTDTVLDLDVPAPNPPLPSFPDIFPNIFGWVDDLSEHALQWFIFCKDVFTAIPTPLKVTFLGGMTVILAGGVIKKLLF